MAGRNPDSFDFESQENSNARAAFINERPLDKGLFENRRFSEIALQKIADTLGGRYQLFVITPEHQEARIVFEKPLEGSPVIRIVRIEDRVWWTVESQSSACAVHPADLTVAEAKKHFSILDNLIIGQDSITILGNCPPMTLHARR